MIRAKLLSGNSVVEGSEELVAQWRATADSRLWLDIESRVDDGVRKLLEEFGLDPLAINDASRDRHPPKIEEFDNNTFILFRGITSLDERLELQPQQLAIFVGDRFLITVHSGRSVSIGQLWSDAENKPAMLQDTGLLALNLIHYAAGRYLKAILEFEDKLGDLEDSLLTGDGENAMKDLVAYRSRLRVLRRIFSYHQRLAEHALNGAGKHLAGEGEQDNLHKRRDLFDRCERIYSLCSMYYEICGDLVEGHISLSSHRLNNTMKVLTIITAVFVPLGFLAGVYGMNFDNMPELHHPKGYFFILGTMATIASGMLLLFRKIRWL
ncbi:Mg2+ transporter protein, CorA family protein [Luminiphilus syltensis NOR5-1B]|uniref:Mg2+ transporter protein, CorA family protein n=1 Tax=Luminiphilus syltensis NOR5-1B TaxID=565045 RepID=B8KVI4_9GAMM|nr:magnesium transporter CorA family protein [Luminiphilus syltensis]EED34576.1 Mg2+ transporter protein, CorA family protein [Luminiphilus syltensis NOR5-1B]